VSETAVAASLFPNWSGESTASSTATAPAAGTADSSARAHANGNGHHYAGGQTAVQVVAAPVATAPNPLANPMDAALAGLMGDAPFCDVCGHITVRNGACYKCLNCGNSLGCS
jgi:ribonucleoside-diphosphate reductase alpha chain